MRRLLLLAALLAAAGCLSLRPAPRVPGARFAAQLAPPAECARLDRLAIGMTISSVVTGAGGGLAGAVAPYVEDAPAQYSIAGAGAVLSTYSAIASYLATHYAQRYAERCTFNVGGKP